MVGSVGDTLADATTSQVAIKLVIKDYPEGQSSLRQNFLPYSSCSQATQTPPPEQHPSWAPRPTASMTSSPVQLPSLREIFGDGYPTELGMRDQQMASTVPREPNLFAEGQGLAPSLGRQINRPSADFPFDSATPPDAADRRSSYTSPQSSTNMTPVHGSPASHPTQSTPGTHLPFRGLPPMYSAGDLPPEARNASSPSHHHQPYAPPPSGYSHNQDYMASYGHPHQAAGSSSSTYAAGYEAPGDFPDQRQKRRRGNLPKQVTDILRGWFQDHIAHPYPTEEEKLALMKATSLTMSQISNWFINARRRSVPAGHRQGAETQR